MKKFTTDWFSPNISKFDHILKSFKSKNDINFLEIGSFEGRSSCWFYDTYINNSQNSTLTCVDTFNFNIKEYDKNKIIVKKGRSRDILKNLNENYYDFIYVDGSHTSRDVLEDAVLSFDILKKDGILTFDDYLWQMYPDPVLNPKIGIDSFLFSYKNELQVIEYGYQVSVMKK
jgi:predicted O-methyltransferase YrrM